MNICVPVTADGSVGSSWGRSPRMRIVRIEQGAIVAFEDHDVGWDTVHDAGSEGSHHARIARFLRDQGIEAVVAGHMGDPMVRMLEEMRIRVRLGATGAANAAALAMAADAGRPT
jgi:predicted Fe-Mo cluster-binding NifX family protein